MMGIGKCKIEVIGPFERGIRAERKQAQAEKSWTTTHMNLRPFIC